MNPPPRPAPSHVPTLTEVIEIPETLSSGDVPVAAQQAVAEQSADLPTPVTLSPVPVPVPVPIPAVSPTPVPVPAALPPVQMPAQVPAQVPASVPAPVPVPVAEAASASRPAISMPVPPALPPRTGSGVDEAAMAQRVLNEVQRQIDGMLEYRLREALTPILARTSESLVRELRQELSKTMRDVVSRAVAQEVARQRTRP